ncbi:TadE/TadG family type IV pilus assembly protein [Streptomonospora wellingtoniae]|uniref:TadE/TadG family type IV pilus assembly protein n=1 Tax=Streptomonospora wellingtoniae TaxID=3075544 RepID=A0ABU2KWT0_9ACTN|nr:TadE/TadG family type IV pilus assembly protein [Streptomonospora sp. DSM 45055]MDT0303622.1 TadE/TadG family type IV pilus assembly protein [Streptomonospora sp. DSM 45055]
MSPRDAQRGSMAVELTILTPMLILFAMLMILAGRVTRAEATADEVAHAAARAASMQRSTARAEAAAAETAAAALDSHGLACSEYTLTLDHGGLAPGGAVTAVLDCHIGLGDLSGLALPGTHTVEGEATVVVDTFRGQP